MGGRWWPRACTHVAGVAVLSVALLLASSAPGMAVASASDSASAFSDTVAGVADPTTAPQGNGGVGAAAGDGARAEQLRIAVEGWRLLPHSYAVVGQFVILELLRRGVHVTFQDTALYNPQWEQTTGLFPAAQEDLLRNLDPPQHGDPPPDATLRFSFPFNLTAARGPGPTILHATTEYGVVIPAQVLDSPLNARAIPGTLRDHVASASAYVWSPSRWSSAGFVASGMHPDHVLTAACGVDTELYHPLDGPDGVSKRAALRTSKRWADRFVVLNIGAMTDNKGIKALVAAFEQLLLAYEGGLLGTDQGRPLLALHGMEPLYRSHRYLDFVPKSLVERGDVVYDGSAVTFAEMAQRYQAADVYVSPYRGEGFNMPVLEAAASGLPVIVTAGGSTDDFTHPSFARRVNSEETPRPDGKQLSPDVPHLVDLLLDVYTNSTFRGEAAVAGPRWARSYFTWAHVVDNLLRWVQQHHAGQGMDGAAGLAGLRNRQLHEYIALSGDPSDLAAASNNALELGDTAAAARLWALHCAAGSMKGATAAGDTIYEPPPPATAADARLAACQLRSAALVTPVAGTLGGACEAATRSGHNTTQHVASYRDCRTRDVYDGRRVAMQLRQRVVAAGMDVSDPWAIGDPVNTLHPLAGGYLAVPNVYAQYDDVSPTAHREYMEDMAHAMGSVFPMLAVQAAALDTPRQAPLPGQPGGPPVRVGFVSCNFDVHSVGKVLSGVVGRLADMPDLFEVVVFVIEPTRTVDAADPVRQFLDASRATVVALPATGPKALFNAQVAVAKAQLDVLVFADVAIHVVPYLLSFGRFAPVQCAFWAMPTTSGVPEVDYFVVGEHFLGASEAHATHATGTGAGVTLSAAEPRAPDHSRHDWLPQYSEQVVALSGLGAFLFRPEFTAPAATVVAQRDSLRRELGLRIPADVPIFFCPQALVKVGPRFDSMLVQLLDATVAGTIILVEGKGSAWSAQVRARLERLGATPARVIVLPRLSTSNYALLLGSATVVLDTFPYSGFTTHVEALVMGVPVVTVPAPTVRGSQTAALYRQMGLQDLGLVCDDAGAYVRAAVEVATNATWRAHVQAEIKSHVGALFNDLEAVRSWGDFLRRATTLATLGSASSSA